MARDHAQTPEISDQAMMCVLMFSGMAAPVL
jgi:hypothetical protein